MRLLYTREPTFACIYLSWTLLNVIKRILQNLNRKANERERENKCLFLTCNYSLANHYVDGKMKYLL